MVERKAPADRADPAVRASERVHALRERDARRRIAAAVSLCALAITTPLAAEPLTGDPGAMVGAIVAALLLAALAVAVWPYDWTPEESRHHELDSIWREIRPDAGLATPWERYGAWAEPARGSVELSRIRCAAGAPLVAGAPSPYAIEVVRHLDPDDVDAAAEAMEELRADASTRELEARDRFERETIEAEQLAHEQAMRKLDAVAAAELRAREAEQRRELAREEAAERDAQAEAVARALRRP